MAKVLFIPDSGAGGVSSLGGAAADRRIGMMITCKGNTRKDEQFTTHTGSQYPNNFYVYTYACCICMCFQAQMNENSLRPCKMLNKTRITIHA